MPGTFAVIAIVPAMAAVAVVSRPLAVFATVPAMSATVVVARLITPFSAWLPGLNRVNRPTAAFLGPVAAMVDLKQRLFDSPVMIAGNGAGLRGAVRRTGRCRIGRQTGKQRGYGGKKAEFRS